MRCVLVTLFCVLGWAGCDRCAEGVSWCTGDGLTHCEHGRPTISFCCAQDGCQDVEVDGVPTAVCSPTNEPDPRCEGAAPLDDICVDGVRLHCDAGYSGFEQECAHACVTPEPGIALCALADAPDPRCGESNGRRCSGNTILKCAFGYAVSEETCVAPFDTCAYDRDNLGGMHPTCATALPEPSCAGDPPGRCSGLDIFGCAEGRRTFMHCVHGCYENPVDSIAPEPFCEPRPCSIE